MKIPVLLFACLLLCVGCTQKPEVKFKKASFDQIKGWKSQNFGAVATTFAKSCDKILAKKDTGQNIHQREEYGQVSSWHGVCNDLKTLEDGDLKSFFERRFQVFELKGKGNGLFTGYYHPEIDGRFEKTEGYTVPLHKKPGDLITVNLGDFAEDLKGRNIVGRVEQNKFVPYPKRSEIEKDRDNVLLWVKDEIEAFFLQIQGSGKVKLADGSAVQVAYTANNGHPYTSVGKVLIDQGEMAKEDVTLYSLKTWFKAHEEKRKNVFARNARYIFFRLANEGPIGSQGVVLTPEYSAAIDPSVIQMGAPVFIDTTLTATQQPFQKLMIAQDTGAAITGAARADIYFGEGQQAEQNAASQNSAGKMYILVPH